MDRLANRLSHDAEWEKYVISLNKFKLGKVSGYLRMVASHPRPLRLTLGLVMVNLGLSRLLTIRMNGYRLRFHPTSLSLAFFVDSRERYIDEYYVRSLLREGHNFIDIGANIGSVAIPASEAVGALGSVYAFEPHPETSAVLSSNLRLNRISNVVVFTAAAGDVNGSIHFSDKGADDQNGVTVGEAGILVPVRRLDAILAGTLPIRMLKIDAEGYELPVLRGCAGLLGNVDIVYYESDEAHAQRYGYSTADIIAFLEPYGFGVYRLDPAAKVIERVPAGLVSTAREYLFAVRKLDELAALL